MDIQGKTALITGASSGMGPGIAHAMVQAGAKVILLARGKDGLDKVATEINSKGGQAHVYPVELRMLQKKSNRKLVYLILLLIMQEAASGCL